MSTPGRYEYVPFARARTRNARRAFTLMELMVVMGIIILLMALAVPVLTRGRGSALRAATVNVKAALALTRQWAITKRTPTTVLLGFGEMPDGSERSYYRVTNAVHGVVEQTTFLPEGIVLAELPESGITFRPDGSTAGRTEDQTFFITENMGDESVAFRVAVSGPTGMVSIRETQREKR